MKVKFKPVASSKNFKQLMWIGILKIVLICIFLILFCGCTVEKVVPIKIDKPQISCRQTAKTVRDVFNCSIMLDEAQK